VFVMSSFSSAGSLTWAWYDIHCCMSGTGAWGLFPAEAAGEGVVPSGTVSSPEAGSMDRVSEIGHDEGAMAGGVAHPELSSSLRVPLSA
jgi:hypothetical protein